MTLLLLAGLSVASATELSLGGFTTLNDPFLITRGVAGSVSAPIAVPFRLGARASFSPAPARDDGDWRPLTTQLVEDNSVSPDISRTRWTAMLVGEVPVVRGTTSELTVDLRLHGGVGWIHTVDDLVALQAVDDERAQSTERQTRSATAYGLSTVVSPAAGPGVRVCLEWVDHIETVNATRLELKSAMRLGLEASFALGASVSADGETP